MATNTPAATAEAEVPEEPAGGLFKRVLPKREVADFCRQLAVLLDAGIPMVRALKILGRRRGSPQMVALVQGVTTDVEAGSAFSTALRTRGPTLPGVVVPLCKAGEKAGELTRNLRHLAETLEHDVEVTDKVRAALIFPLFTLVFTGFVVTGMLLWIAPLFKDTLDQIDGMSMADMPWISRVVFNASDALQSGTVKMLLLGVLIGGAILLYRAATHRSYLLDFMKIRLPLLGYMVTMGAMARFAQTLSALLRTGVPVLESLRLSRATVDNLAIEQAIVAMENSVENGGRMSTPLEEFWYIPEMARDMLVIGEESGSMAEMLENLADVFRAEVDRIQRRLIALIQPVMTMVLGVIVLLVLISMFLPYITVLTGGAFS
jgi:type IV pilus assembly protein PilC